MGLKYLHTMVRVNNLEESMNFYCSKLGLEEVVRWDYPDDKFTLVMLAAPGDSVGAGRAHLQLWSGKARWWQELRTPGLFGEQHLRALSAADGRRGHHQSAAA